MHKKGWKLRIAMMNGLEAAKESVNKKSRAISLTLLMLTSITLALIPTTTASHTTQYAVQRDPLYISIGDLNCDGHNDIASGSGFGHFISVLYNDGDGGFGDRQDIQISNNDSFRAGFRDVADGNKVEIADVDGDGINDLIYYQENVRFVGETFVRPANLTVIKGECDDTRVNEWIIPNGYPITITNPYLQAWDVDDIDGDGTADVVFSSTDSTFTNQFIQIFRGPDYSILANQQSIPVPLTNGLYTSINLGNWGETLQTIPNPDPTSGGEPIIRPGECEDLDIWLLRSPPFSSSLGYASGTYDNVTVLELDCLTKQYPNPLTPASGTFHDFKLDAEHNFPLYGIDIADTTDDDINQINLIAAVDGITGNVSYATRNGNTWNTQNYVAFGDYLGASLTIADVNNDGELDFFVPTSLTLLDTQESTAQNQTYLLRPNLRAVNTVQILLADPDSDGYLSPLSFDVGRRPTMAMPGQLQGGPDSALEVVIGQEDYTYRFSNNAMWLDTQGYAGQGDYLSVLALDNYDLGITKVSIEPSILDPATFEDIVGEGNRWVNVTIKNTGLMPISGANFDVSLNVKEVLGGTDTIVYSNDFESSNPNVNLDDEAYITKHSYTGEYESGESSWHIDDDRFWESGVTYDEGDIVHRNNTDYQCGGNNTTSCDTDPEEDNSSWYEISYWEHEADSNPSSYYWAGVTHSYDFNGNSTDVTGYYNHMDEALILNDIDLTGADAAFLDMDAICSVGFFELFLAEPYDVVERWLYEDSCSIEAWSDGTGWETVWRYGGWDNERKYRIEERISSAPDPEYNDYNDNDYGDYHTTLWNNYTEGGGDPDSCFIPYLQFGYPVPICFEEGGLDQKADSIDLTPYAGEVIDLRFRFRTGLEGTTGPEGSTDYSEMDGFAIDNITIRKRNVEFGPNPTEDVQQKQGIDLVAGQSITVSLNADFIDDTTYYVSTELSNINLGGQSDADGTNDETKFQLTVENLYDPGLFEEPWIDLENGELYASGVMPITVGVQNWGNTVVEFDVEAKIYNAEPELIAIEDFSGQVGKIWDDDNDEDGKENGDRLDDSFESNEMLPQNVGVFKNYAYWLGHPSTGYEDDWNETLSLEPIEIKDSGADFTFLSFDYYAEGDHIADRFGNVQTVRDYAYLEATWSKGGDVYQGTIYGSWTDLNENGLRLAYNSIGGNFYHYCEDFDQNGLFEEVEYAGDHSGGVGQDGWPQWFDSDELISTARIDLTHIHLVNTTNPDSFTYECTSLAGSDVTFTWRFRSNNDSVNGNAGFAGFALDNIRVEDYTFEDDGIYTQTISGLDASEKSTVVMGEHNFVNGLYKIDLMTLYDNSDNTSKWFDKPEISIANNQSTILFGIANADITLLQPDILDCVSDITYACVYPTSPNTFDSHDFTIPLLNGVIEGSYDVRMIIEHIESGNIVYNQSSDNGTFDLDPHQRAVAHWESPYSNWMDNNTYNISFLAILFDEFEWIQSGNERFFEISFYDKIDVAILSNPTDQNRLQRVKSDLDAMGMTYTQFETSDWNKYVTNQWLDGYSKVLLPWQTDYNVEYGDYYELLGTKNPDNSDLTAIEVLETFMRENGTLQIHLGPYRDYYQDSTDTERIGVPFDLDIAMRNRVNLTIDQRIKSQNLSFNDPFHPIMKDLDTSAFSVINAGSHVALSGLDTTQVGDNNMPKVCMDASPGASENGYISGGGTFHSLIGDKDNIDQSVLAVCSVGNGGIIVTTIDVENPTVSTPYGDSLNFSLLSNMLAYQLTPYPSGFEVASQGFDLTIDGRIQPIDPNSLAYERTAIKSNATLQFNFEIDSELAPIISANWVIESVDGSVITGWDGEPLGDDNWHIYQPSNSVPVTATFCIEDISADLGCKIDAEWRIWLYLSDSEGHTRITNISVYTNDVKADNDPPSSTFEILNDATTSELIELIGTQPTPVAYDDELDEFIMTDSSVYRVTLDENSQTTTVYFSAAGSTDIGTGIQVYRWLVTGAAMPDQEFIINSPEYNWSYTFDSVTPNNNPLMIELYTSDFRFTSDPPYRMFFEVVSSDFGDEEVVSELDNLFTADGERFDALDSVDIINVTGVIRDNDISSECDVTVEVALDDKSIFDKGPGTKSTQKDEGKYNSISGLCDGDSYSLSLNISHLYVYGEEYGSEGNVYIRITEAGHTPVEEEIYLYTLPRALDPCEANPESCEEESGTLNTIMIGGIATIILLLVVVITFLLRNRRSRNNQQDSVETFGGVEQMDPVEAYVQQLVAQGYDEQMARQYAQQYYAQYYDQQKRSGG